MCFVGMRPVGNLSERRRSTKKRLRELRRFLRNAESIAANKACAYATGSFGREEASEHSDLDLFIVGKHSDGGSQLKRLDEICIKADLIEATRYFKIPEFSGDGRYLAHYSVGELTRTLGTPEDDVTNTFTARLLLLLESRPVLGEEVHREVIEEVVAAYWRDYPDHKRNFRPAFLANDILRLWRTFCVNYEARTKRVPEREKAKGKIKNYKLGHSRLLTCYSALLYLLEVHRTRKTVHPSDAIHIAGITPTERLEWLIAESKLPGARQAIRDLLDQYEKFLEVTDCPEERLIERFLDKTVSKDLMSDAYTFGDLMFAALTIVGEGSGLYRLLVV